jgi:hypothetical protein
MTPRAPTHCRTRRFLTEERGTATIEFLVTLPLFLAALAFVFEFGRYFVAYQQTANNVRSAARYISQVDLTPDNESKAEKIIRTGRPDGNDSDAPDYLKDLCFLDTDIPRDCIIRDNGSIPIRIEVHVHFPLTLFKFIDPKGNAVSLPFRIVEYVQPVGVTS